jgi:hypothetical protein
MILDVKPEGLVIAAHFQSRLVGKLIPNSDVISQRLIKAGVIKLEIPPAAKQACIKSLLTLTTSSKKTLDALTQKGVRVDIKVQDGWRCVNIKPKEDIKDLYYGELFQETVRHDTNYAYTIAHEKDVVDYLWMFMDQYEYLASCIQDGQYVDDSLYIAFSTVSNICPFFASIYLNEPVSPFKDIALKANVSYSKLTKVMAEHIEQDVNNILDGGEPKRYTSEVIRMAESAKITIADLYRRLSELKAVG